MVVPSAPGIGQPPGHDLSAATGPASDAPPIPGKFTII